MGSLRAAPAVRVERRAQPHHQCRSSGVNSCGMKSIFSTPMPCSPVTLPPSADALVQDLVAGRQHALHLIGVAFVEQQDRVNVAVAGMEDVADAHVVLLRRCA